MNKMLSKLESMLEKTVVNKMRAKLNGDEEKFEFYAESQKDIEDSIMELKGLL